MNTLTPRQVDWLLYHYLRQWMPDTAHLVRCPMLTPRERRELHRKGAFEYAQVTPTTPGLWSMLAPSKNMIEVTRRGDELLSQHRASDRFWLPWCLEGKGWGE